MIVTVAPADVWETAYDAEGTVYWYNGGTGVSQYEDPNAQGDTQSQSYDEYTVGSYNNEIQEYPSPESYPVPTHNNQDDGGGPETHTDWGEAYDEDGNIYYYNSVSGISQYESPY